MGEDILAYVGCIAGAILVSDYERMLKEAGFESVQVVDTRKDLNAYTKGEVADACWGIYVAPDLTSRPERFEAATIKNNVVRNAGAVGIGLASCVECVVENNLVVFNPAGPTYVPLTDFGPTNSLNTGSIAIFARNNDPNQSIIFVATGEGDTAMSLLPPCVLIKAGGLETSQSCQSLGTSWTWFL